jgi:hypothetical protein
MMIKALDMIQSTFEIQLGQGYRICQTCQSGEWRKKPSGREAAKQQRNEEQKALSSSLRLRCFAALRLKGFTDD